MYQRDKNVEKAESLERILIALDRLADVVAKDETSKEILSSLKEKGAKDVRDVPTANDRADEIQYSRTKTRTGGGNGESVDNNSLFDPKLFQRLNNSFKALSGDMGGFTRLVSDAAKSGWRQKLSSHVSGGTLTEMVSPIKGYKDAERWYLDKMEKVTGSLAGAYKALGDKLSPDSNQLFKFLQEGFDPKRSAKILTDRKKESLVAEAVAATGERRPVRGTAARGVAALMEGEGLSTWGKIAAGIAISAAPIVLGKLVQAGAVSQIEGARPFAMLNGQMANNFAMYDVNKMFGNMRIARGISSSVQSLMASETEFSRTMEPIKILSSNVVNRFLEGGLDMVSGVLKPMSNIARVLGEDKRSQAILQEMGSGAGIGAFWGTILGGLAGIPGGPAGIAAGAAWGAAAGGVGGATIGGVGEAIGGARAKALQEMKDLPHKTMIDVFATSIEAKPVCPAQRFVP